MTGVLLVCLLPGMTFAGGPDTVESLPTLDEAVKLALANNRGKSESDTLYEVKKYYYQLLEKRNSWEFLMKFAGI